MSSVAEFCFCLDLFGNILAEPDTESAADAPEKTANWVCLKIEGIINGKKFLEWVRTKVGEKTNGEKIVDEILNAQMEADGTSEKYNKLLVSSKNAKSSLKSKISAWMATVSESKTADRIFEAVALSGGIGEWLEDRSDTFKALEEKLRNEFKTVLNETYSICTISLYTQIEAEDKPEVRVLAGILHMTINELKSWLWQNAGAPLVRASKISASGVSELLIRSFTCKECGSDGKHLIPYKEADEIRYQCAACGSTFSESVSHIKTKSLELPEEITSTLQKIQDSVGMVVDGVGRLTEALDKAENDKAIALKDLQDELAKEFPDWPDHSKIEKSIQALGYQEQKQPLAATGEYILQIGKPNENTAEKTFIKLIKEEYNNIGNREKVLIVKALFRCTTSKEILKLIKEKFLEDKEIKNELKTIADKISKEQDHIDEGYYDAKHHRLFIAIYDSSDLEKVESIVTELERRYGPNSIYLSHRNHKSSSAEGYCDALDAAIENCDGVIIFSSYNLLNNPKSDVFEKELPKINATPGCMYRIQWFIESDNSDKANADSPRNEDLEKSLEKKIEQCINGAAECSSDYVNVKGDKFLSIEAAIENFKERYANLINEKSSSRMFCPKCGYNVSKSSGNTYCPRCKGGIELVGSTQEIFEYHLRKSFSDNFLDENGLTSGVGNKGWGETVIENLENKIDKQKKELEKLPDLIEKSDRVKNLESKTTELEKENGTLKSDKQRLSTEKKQLEDCLSDNETKLKELAMVLRTTRAEKESVEKDRDEKASDLETANETIARQEKALTVKESKIKALEEQCAVAEQDKRKAVKKAVDEAEKSMRRALNSSRDVVTAKESEGWRAWPREID